jgi:hypothetical protein
MSRGIDYGSLMHRAMRGLIQSVLEDVAANGLPGDHHFFITFNTRVDGVEIADWLRERYPEELTIVVQNWFENLIVDENGFEITLNFGDNPEALKVPFDAVMTFVDPSVEFGLRFEAHDHDDDEDDFDDEDDDDTPEPPRGDAEVVSLDKWRK